MRRNMTLTRAGKSRKFRGMPDPLRKDILLRAAFDMIRKAELTHYVESPLEILTHYDEADCDGSCLADDIAAELDIERDALPLS